MKVNSYWLIIGLGCLGLLVGLMVGLSISPVVGAVLSLVFAFAGSSIIVLTTKREGELALIGKCLTSFSLTMIAALIIGINIRVHYSIKIANCAKYSSRYILEKPLTIEEIINISKQDTNKQIIKALIKARPKDSSSIILNKSDISRLCEEKVSADIIELMLLETDTLKNSNLAKAITPVLFNGNKIEGSLRVELERLRRANTN
jgi:hypothetical protein